MPSNRIVQFDEWLLSSEYEGRSAIKRLYGLYRPYRSPLPRTRCTKGSSCKGHSFKREDMHLIGFAVDGKPVALSRELQTSIGQPAKNLWDTKASSAAPAQSRLWPPPCRQLRPRCRFCPHLFVLRSGTSHPLAELGVTGVAGNALPATRILRARVIAPRVSFSIAALPVADSTTSVLASTTEDGHPPVLNGYRINAGWRIAHHQSPGIPQSAVCE